MSEARSVEYKEAKLFPPLKKWLNERGFKVYSEVRSIDVVACNGNIQEAFEMKISCTKKVINQAMAARGWCDASYVAIKTNPKPHKIELCKKFGIGIIQIKDDEVIIHLEPKHNKPFQKFDFKNWEEGETSGLPQLKGVGVAQDCAKRVKEYIEKNPQSRWEEIYKNVKNHYSSHNSLRQSMGSWCGLYHYPPRKNPLKNKKPVDPNQTFLDIVINRNE